MSYSELTEGQRPPANDAVALPDTRTTDRTPTLAQSGNRELALTECVHPTRSWLGTALRVIALLAMITLLAVGGAYWLLRQEPGFYQSALAIPDTQAYQDGQDLEIAALYWRNDLIESDEWFAELSEDQINGWLASDLTRKFASFLPKGFDDPRVQIEPGRLSVAFRTTVQNIPTVMVATVEVFPTNTSNRVGVRIHGVHAGWLPIPVSVFTQPSIDMLKRQKIDVQWYDDSDGDPVALLTIPKKQLAIDDHHVIIDQLEIAEGSLRVAGGSESLKPVVVVDETK